VIDNTSGGVSLVGLPLQMMGKSRKISYYSDTCFLSQAKRPFSCRRSLCVCRSLNISVSCRAEANRINSIRLMICVQENRILLEGTTGLVPVQQGYRMMWCSPSSLHSKAAKRPPDLQCLRDTMSSRNPPCYMYSVRLNVEDHTTILQRENSQLLYIGLAQQHLAL